MRDGTPRNAGAGNILEIYVFAERWDNLCHRYIAVSIGNWAVEKNNIFGYLEYYRHQYIARESDNFNHGVLQFIKKRSLNGKTIRFVGL